MRAPAFYHRVHLQRRGSSSSQAKRPHELSPRPLSKGGGLGLGAPPHKMASDCEKLLIATISQRQPLFLSLLGLTPQVGIVEEDSLETGLGGGVAGDRGRGGGRGGGKAGRGGGHISMQHIKGAGT